MAIIIADKLRRVWPIANKQEVVAVASLSFTVEAGEVYGLLGPNGAGKTTTIRMLATLTHPTSGTALLCGHDVVKAPGKVRQSIGYVSVSSGLPTLLTVQETVETFAALHGCTRPDAPRLALERFGLSKFTDRTVDALSTGLRQRLRLACATVHQPPIWILDEPTSGLDVMAADELLSAVKIARQEGTAVLFSTHDMGIAEDICDRIAIMHGGKIHAVDTADGLRTRTQSNDLRKAFVRLVQEAAQ